MRVASRLAVMIIAALLPVSIAAQTSPGWDLGFVGSARPDAKIDLAVVGP